MLVLFKGELRSTAPLPTGEVFEFCGKQVETLMAYRQDGKIVAGGIIAGRKGSYAIFDVDSIEELQGLIAQTPLFPFIEVELTPLVSYESALDLSRKLASG